MTTGKLNPPGARLRAWSPSRSGWPERVGYAAAAWSMVYGLLGPYWTFGGLSTLFPWPVVNRLVLILGGLLWAATAVAHQRRTRNACGHCGRSDATSGWTTAASAARWGRWAVAIAVAVPILYASTRWT